jgi:hypothetical protein
MPEVLSSLAYYSHSNLRGDPQAIASQVREILATARRVNAERGVTGVLLFSDHCFAQVLEGPPDAVATVYAAIQRDPRHRDLVVLHDHPVNRRSFGAWSMGFGGIDGVSHDPGLREPGTLPVDAVLASESGQNLLAALRMVVRRDDLARRDEPPAD